MTNYMGILNLFYPEVKCYASGNKYTDIIWEGIQVPQADLDVKELDYVKYLGIEHVRAKANEQRDMVYEKIMETTDYTLLRVYEEKRKQSIYYKTETDAGRTPQAILHALLSEEATYLGIPEYTLATMVITQGDLADQQMLPMLGQIEGKRRAVQYQIKQATTVQAVNTIVNAPIAWPDQSTLQTI